MPRRGIDVRLGASCPKRLCWRCRRWPARQLLREHGRRGALQNPALKVMRPAAIAVRTPQKARRSGPGESKGAGRTDLRSIPNLARRFPAEFPPGFPSEAPPSNSGPEFLDPSDRPLIKCAPPRPKRGAYNNGPLLMDPPHKGGEAWPRVGRPTLGSLYSGSSKGSEKMGPDAEEGASPKIWPDFASQNTDLDETRCRRAFVMRQSRMGSSWTAPARDFRALCRPICVATPAISSDFGLLVPAPFVDLTRISARTCSRTHPTLEGGRAPPTQEAPDWRSLASNQGPRTGGGARRIPCVPPPPRGRPPAPGRGIPSTSARTCEWKQKKPGCTNMLATRNCPCRPVPGRHFAAPTFSSIPRPGAPNREWSQAGNLSTARAATFGPSSRPPKLPNRGTQCRRCVAIIEL